MKIKDLETKWNTIDPYSGGYLLISGEHPLSFHVGYHTSDLKSFIVLDTGKIENLYSSKAITAECIEMRNGYILKFNLNHSSLDEIFVKLCWDLLESSKTSQRPADQIFRQYSKWMRLLQKAIDDSLSASQQKGLVGELLYINKLLTKLEPDKVIKAWVGPEGSDQDFNFYDSWAEVKSVSIAATDVQISSLQQLSRHDTGYLIVYFMDKTTVAGAQSISLPRIISQIEERLITVSLDDVFQCKLAQYGYLKRDECKYLNTYYRFEKYCIYGVVEGFPKLVRTNVPDAVVNTKYLLDLLMLEKWKVKEG